MFKGLASLFRCCKSQNKMNKEQQGQYIDNKENVISEKADIEKNYNGFMTEKNYTKEADLATAGNEKNEIHYGNQKEYNNFNSTSTNHVDLNMDNCNLHYHSKINNDELIERKKNMQAEYNNFHENIDKSNFDLKTIEEKITIESKQTINKKMICEIPLPSETQQNNCETNEKILVNGEINNIEEDEFNTIIVPDRYIREDEHLIKWTKNGMIEYINKLKVLDDYTEIKTKEIGLDIRIRKTGSELSNKIFLVKGIYKVSKNEFEEGITMEFMKNLIYIPELRTKWDDGYKELMKLEGSEEVYVIKSWMKSPIFIISERDAIDKRIEFFKDGVYYNFSSSVEDNFVPEQKGVVRCKNYLNIFTLEQDKEFYYFTSINQCDIKMALPQSIMNITVPSRLVSWYKNFVQVANKEYMSIKDNTISN